jgi:hypothetical protein
MPAISRRRFLRDASLGAAAVGAIAAVGPSGLGLSSSSPGPEVMAHVVDRSSGTISIYSGTRKVTFQNRAVTETLLKALQ